MAFSAIATRRGDYPKAGNLLAMWSSMEESMRHNKPVFPLAAAFALAIALVSGILFFADSPVYAADPVFVSDAIRPGLWTRKHAAGSQHRRPHLGHRR